jgi:hypothetical protein
LPKVILADDDTGKVAIVEDDGTIHDTDGNSIPGVTNVKEAIAWTKRQEMTKE